MSSIAISSTVSDTATRVTRVAILSFRIVSFPTVTNFNTGKILTGGRNKFVCNIATAGFVSPDVLHFPRGTVFPDASVKAFARFWSSGLQNAWNLPRADANSSTKYRSEIQSYESQRERHKINAKIYFKMRCLIGVKNETAYIANGIIAVDCSRRYSIRCWTLISSSQVQNCHCDSCSYLTGCQAPCLMIIITVPFNRCNESARVTDGPVWKIQGRKCLLSLSLAGDFEMIGSGRFSDS